ncbi:MAG: glycosyltransferase family 4 protein [Candidatus Tectimicrobiota bacterium]
MPRVLLLSLVYSPDTVSTANLLTEMAQSFQKYGHEVTVLTSMPHYNPSEEVRQHPVYRPPLPRLFTEANEGGVRVLRVYMPLKRQRLWLRAVDYLWFHFITTLVALGKIGPQDIIFVLSPPITLGLSGYLLAQCLGGKLIYDVLELWPDVPVRMGLIRHPLLLRLVYAMEAFVYRRATVVTCIARTFMESLRQRGVPAEKLRFTPVFVDIDLVTPGRKDNAFAREHKLEHTFVAFYAGNIGLTQGLEILVAVAQELRYDEDICIVVIGDGAGRSLFEQAVAGAGLQNILCLPFQPYKRIAETYATADVCLSPMRAGFSYDTVPSKIYTAMAAGRPVIAAAEQDTETARLLQESQAGVVVTPESAVEMAAAIRQLHDAPARAHTMGQKARNWIVEHYSKDVVLTTYDQILREAGQQ